jgi:hypothetical protein
MARHVLLQIATLSRISDIGLLMKELECLLLLDFNGEDRISCPCWKRRKDV